MIPLVMAYAHHPFLALVVSTAAAYALIAAADYLGRQR